MGQSNGKHQPRYSLGAIGAAQIQLTAILEKAAADGTQIAATKALDVIEARLRTDPTTFGEPLYHLRKAKMIIRCVAVIPLYVEYGVHDEQPVVVIRRVVSLAAQSP